MRALICFLIFTALVSPAAAARYDVTEKSIATLEQDMASGRVTSEELVRAYLARIRAIDSSGPTLRSVIAINPNAIADARALDAERKGKGARGPLHGIPILIKDNIETADPMPTTAGSLALADNVTHRDAPVVAKLRAAGVVILGKANLSEWANIRSSHSLSGWSAVGGLVKNPYALDRTACGSSSGSGAAVAASLAAAALGTETDGSLVCPGSMNGIVSLKPTVGLLSRTHIVPISHSQDTPGPMTRTVADAALLLSVMAGSDPGDPATADADAHKKDYSAALTAAPPQALKGQRLAVFQPSTGIDASDADAIYAKAIEALKSAGAEIVAIKPVAVPPSNQEDELVVLEYELKHDLNAYFASLPPGSKMHTLADVIAFNDATPRETVLFGQEIFQAAQGRKDTSDADYITRRDKNRGFARSTLDGIFNDNHADALVEITTGAAFLVDTVHGDGDGGSSSFLPAVAGYPHLTVPLGYVRGVPFGLSFIGPAWSEAKLLALGHAFETVCPVRHVPTYIPSLEATPAVTKAFAAVAD